jgi:hypothetical protein
LLRQDARGLQNAGSTFNRMMKLILGSQLARNASAYVDDIVIMSVGVLDRQPTKGSTRSR